MSSTAPISFARGAPSLDIIAVDELKAAAQRAFTNDPGGSFAYGTSRGYLPLRDWIADYQGLAPEQSELLNARLILLLANQVGDAQVLRDCIEAAARLE